MTRTENIVYYNNYNEYHTQGIWQEQRILSITTITMNITYREYDKNREYCLLLWISHTGNMTKTENIVYYCEYHTQGIWQEQRILSITTITMNITYREYEKTENIVYYNEYHIQGIWQKQRILSITMNITYREYDKNREYCLLQWISHTGNMTKTENIVYYNEYHIQGIWQKQRILSVTMNITYREYDTNREYCLLRWISHTENVTKTENIVYYNEYHIQGIWHKQRILSITMNITNREYDKNREYCLLLWISHTENMIKTENIVYYNEYHIQGIWQKQRILSITMNITYREYDKNRIDTIFLICDIIFLWSFPPPPPQITSYTATNYAPLPHLKY